MDYEKDFNSIRFFLVGCTPKSTPENDAVLSEIHEIRSRIKVGISYLDYSDAAQELQIKLDNMARSEKSMKTKHAGNLGVVGNQYVLAAEKEDYEEWSPEFFWYHAELSYIDLEKCLNSGESCYEVIKNPELSME